MFWTQVNWFTFIDQFLSRLYHKFLKWYGVSTPNSSNTHYSSHYYLHHQVIIQFVMNQDTYFVISFVNNAIITNRTWHCEWNFFIFFHWHDVWALTWLTCLAAFSLPLPEHPIRRSPVHLCPCVKNCMMPWMWFKQRPNWQGWG